MGKVSLRECITIKISINGKEIYMLQMTVALPVACLSHTCQSNLSLILYVITLLDVGSILY